MAEIKYQPIPHDHEVFLAKARLRKSFSAECDFLELEHQVASQMLEAKSRADLTQDVVAARMGMTKGAISRLESAGKHNPSLAEACEREADRREAELDSGFAAELPGPEVMKRLRSMLEQ